jgi:hypothetical protein
VRYEYHQKWDGPFFCVFHQVGGVSFAHALEKKRNFVENVEKDDGL